MEAPANTNAPENRSAPYILGLDPEGDMFNIARVKEVADAIVADLRVHLANSLDGVSQISQRTAAYKQGLTLGEVQLAIIQALAIFQIETTKTLACMYFEKDEDEDDVA